MSELLFNLNDLHLPPPTIQLYDEVMLTYFSFMYDCVFDNDSYSVELCF